ncbi:MAG: hypothetical protein LBM69_06795 [Lachnospiraceae bacterium]|jgi:hypothetical protein|nr:hypothetical protein [Lachnospiraceae bacterium]
MRIHFNALKDYFTGRNNSKPPFGNLRNENTRLNNVVDMINQREQTVGNDSALLSVSKSMKTSMQQNNANDRILTSQEAAIISSEMSKVVPKFNSGDPNAIVKASFIHKKAMSIEEAASSIPRKINGDGTITAPGLDELRENGLPQEINYEELDDVLSFNVRYAGVFNVDSFADITDYLASTYVVLRDRIKNDFTEETQAAQIEQLDKFMGRHIDRFSAQFAHVMGDFSTQIGIDESDEFFYLSAKEAIVEQTKQYQEYIAENPDYADINESADSWLNRHTEYLSSHLRSAFSSSEPVSSTAKVEKLYSKNELTAISNFAKSVTEVWNSIHVTGVMSEEEIGLKLGMMMLSVDVLIDARNIPENYKNRASEYTKAVSQKQMDLVNQELESFQKPSLFPELDTAVVQNIIEAMRDEYAHTKNVSGAIQKGAALGYTSYHNRLSMSQIDTITTIPHRYSYQSTFWSTMYANGDSSGHYQNPSVLEKFHVSLSRVLGNDIPFQNYLNQTV